MNLGKNMMVEMVKDLLWIGWMRIGYFFLEKGFDFLRVNNFRVELGTR